jgi:hypothetical protein
MTDTLESHVTYDMVVVEGKVEAIPAIRGSGEWTKTAEVKGMVVEIVKSIVGTLTDDIERLLARRIGRAGRHDPRTSLGNSTLYALRALARDATIRVTEHAHEVGRRINLTDRLARRLSGLARSYKHLALTGQPYAGEKAIEDRSVSPEEFADQVLRDLGIYIDPDNVLKFVK